jgi:hypothetical protein
VEVLKNTTLDSPVLHAIEINLTMLKFSAIADLVGWVKERNLTSILLLESVCWVSFYSNQPTVLNRLLP